MERCIGHDTMFMSGYRIINIEWIYVFEWRYVLIMTSAGLFVFAFRTFAPPSQRHYIYNIVTVL